MQLPEGIVAIVKQDCATCQMVVPVLEDLRDRGLTLTVYTQDEPGFPAGLDPIDDTALEVSYHVDMTTVPTLLRIEDGQEVARTEGWVRQRWEDVTGIADLGADLPEFRPGCGSLTADPLIEHHLRALYSGESLRSRRVELAIAEDEIEAMYDRGWSDGLPLVPPTAERVLAMLTGTWRLPDELVATVPPDLVPCTIEKVAVNAVMAGCRPEYLPVVLAAVEAACTDTFNGHGLLATTWFSSPVVIVNGPIAQSIGMNSGPNALGQGNRANATIGRALQLVIRNVGGGRPGGVDRATLGNPGKYTFCFAEDEEGSPFTPLAAARGIPDGTSAVTLFAGSGVQGMVDQQSRQPDSLTRSLAACLRVVGHPKLPMAFDALVVLSPEHGRIYREAGWSREQLVSALDDLLQLPGDEIIRGAFGIAEGVPPSLVGATLPKFRPGGLLIAHAGGGAGLFSAIIGGWASGEVGSEPLTVPVDPWT